MQFFLYNIQKALDKVMATHHASLFQSRTPCDVDKVRLLAASSSPSGDWLHAPLIASIELRLSGVADRLAVAQRLGYKACKPHTCICGKPVDAWGLHGLSAVKARQGSNDTAP